MGTAVTTFVDALRHYHLLEGQQLREVKRLGKRYPDAKALAKELLRRAWLTPYQVEQLLEGRGKELLLGSYLLLERIGEGGMGQVFKARNWKLGKVVALKVIRPERLKNRDALRRFKREARAAARLSHPNVVMAYDADEVDGAHLLVMEYVEGTDLSKLLREKRRPLPVEQACDIIRQAALGLQHAHDKGLVHRDIKPSNLLLAADGATVKILDLGLARVLEAATGETMMTELTQYGSIIGTPDYMAPEQSRQSHNVDIRADVYSLGCTFYFLCTAQPPFSGSTITERLMQHQLEEAPPVEKVRSEVPLAVAQIVRKMMAKRPEDRYQTPAEVATALQPFLGAVRLPIAKLALAKGPPSGRGLAASPPPAPRQGSRRRWLRIAIPALLLVVGGIVVAWGLVQRSTSRPGVASLAEKTQPAPRPPGTEQISPPDKRNPPVKSSPAATQVERPSQEPSAVPPEKLAQLQGAVHVLVISATGQLLAGGGADNAIHLWDTTTWRERATLRGHTGEVRALAFAPDGKMMASGSADQSVKLWDVASGREVATLAGHTGSVMAVAFAPDGRTLASGADKDPNVRLWNALGKEVGMWQAHVGGVHSLAFAADAQTLASGGGDKLIRIWDVGMTKEKAALRGHSGPITALAYTPDRQRLVSGTRAGALRLWNPATSTQSQRIYAPKGGLTAMALAPDNQKLVSADTQKRVILWEMEPPRRLDDKLFPEQVLSLAFSPDGMFVVAGTDGGTIHMIRPDLPAGKISK